MAAEQGRTEGRRNLPSGSESCKSSTSFRRLLVLLTGSETISGGEGGSSGTLVCQPEQQRRGWSTGLDLCPQRWQQDRAFDGGNNGGDDGGVASRLWRQSRLALVLSM